MFLVRSVIGHSYLITQLGILFGCVSKCLSMLVVMRSRLSNELSCLAQNMDLLTYLLTYSMEQSPS
jgi:hypothetical protein